jgi:quercetin dioxygenase-like cupin family protein
LKWHDSAGTAGFQQVFLYGDPDKSGPYVMLNRAQPGYFNRPHFHPNDRFVTVIKGTWWIATGNTVDRTRMVPMSTGSFFTIVGKQVHWDGAKDEETWLLIAGEGPGIMTLVKEAN